MIERAPEMHERCTHTCECACPVCVKLTMPPCLPALTPLPDASDNWEVDCHWITPLINSRAVLIRRGFITDGASIPRIAWRFIGHPFSKRLLPHALGHDALYSAELISRKASDAWMLSSMKHALEHYPLGVSTRMSNVVWAALRAGGWTVWNRHTRESIEEARKLVSLVSPEEWVKYTSGEVCMTLA